MIEPEVSTIKPQPADKKKIFKIWWVAGILALVTAAEFYVALQFPESWKGFKIFLFIMLLGLTNFLISDEADFNRI